MALGTMGFRIGLIAIVLRDTRAQDKSEVTGDTQYIYKHNLQQE
jgi:hypothetical protein